MMKPDKLCSIDLEGTLLKDRRLYLDLHSFFGISSQTNSKYYNKYLNDKNYTFQDWIDTINKSWRDSKKELTYERYIDILRTNFTPRHGSRQFLDKLRDLGFITQLVSGTPNDFCDMAKEYYDFDYVAGSDNMIFKDNKWCNLIHGKYFFDNKAKAMEELCARLSISAKYTIAVGDSDNDIEMLRRAGAGFLIHASPRANSMIIRKDCKDSIIPVNKFSDIITHIENNGFR
ncbi:MAG: HAD-IB family phosphatase [Candidatus Aenigmarchaeota archaeon]|nr:HAD-IB family phosphatase [Candidatus Aenigmarchaeota archaeon]